MHLCQGGSETNEKALGKRLKQKIIQRCHTSKDKISNAAEKFEYGKD